MVSQSLQTIWVLDKCPFPGPWLFIVFCQTDTIPVAISGVINHLSRSSGSSATFSLHLHIVCRKAWRLFPPELSPLAVTARREKKSGCMDFCPFSVPEPALPAMYVCVWFLAFFLFLKHSAPKLPFSSSTFSQRCFSCSACVPSSLAVDFLDLSHN